MITAVATVEQQDEFYKEAKFLFQSSSLKICDCASNSKDVLQSISESHRTSRDTALSKSGTVT